MKKSEWVFYSLFQGAKTQLEIAQKWGISLSTVNHALGPLARLGAIEKRKFGFRIIDREKALIYWANMRNLDRDIIYRTHTGSVRNIEKMMPAKAVFTAFSGYKFRFDDVPADYSEIYVYADVETLSEIKKRFPPHDGPTNLIVLATPPILESIKIVSNELLFVDLWNLKEWYAKEFIQALRRRMGLE
ncbi:MAG: hypothetical protein V1776_03760 [Candidatus Diapherotrites archaeon]